MTKGLLLFFGAFFIIMGFAHIYLCSYLYFLDIEWVLAPSVIQGVGLTCALLGCGAWIFGCGAGYKKN